MILVIDIGNTNIVLGCVEKKELVFTARISTDRKKTEDEYALTLQGILEMNQVSCHQIEGGIISSVVPELKTVMSETVRRLTGKTFLVVGSGLKTGLNIRTDAPDKLGSDLVVDAVAASAKYPKPTVIFDMGTATTLSVLDAQGHYIGGMIIPGMRVSVDALSSHAAQLPYINLDNPSEVIGKNTVDCMKAGVIYGHAAMLDGLIDRVEDALGSPVTAVITGGLSRTVVPHCRRKIIYDENLLLDGLVMLYEKNKNPGKK
jgi:type III pantothenate kinase